MKLKGLTFPLKELFVKIFKEDVFLVGGTIRDFLLYGGIGVERDIDLMVTGQTYREIETKLKPYGKTNTVGKSFAVVKFSRDGMTIDISVPRKDVKKDSGSHGHKNFIIESGPHITLEEDLGRRDFTCNSIAMRLSDNTVTDPYGGLDAIAGKTIAMTGPETFSDDPLRILRAARFASAHRFRVDETIYYQAMEITLDELSKERVVDEWFRLLLESEQPSLGMNEYFRMTVLEKLFPPLYPLTLTIQDALFHPEKDEYGHHTVWHHTMVALDIAKKLSAHYKLSDEQTLALLLGVLFHDVGKAVTTKWEWKRGRMTVTSMYHDSIGVEIADAFLTDLRIETRKGFPLRQTVLDLVRSHHRVYDLYRNRADIGFKAISRLVRDLDDHDFLLVLLDVADRRSRETRPLDLSSEDEVVQWFQSKKEEYNINKETIQPIIMGRDLLKLGVAPGVRMGVYLNRLYEKQLDGEFGTKEDGLKLFEMIKKTTGEPGT